MESENEINREVEQFYLLLGQLRKQILQLKNENRELLEENKQLKEKAEQQKDNREEVFSVLGESERIALRHQIDGLIAKIDRHLERS